MVPPVDRGRAGSLGRVRGRGGVWGSIVAATGVVVLLLAGCGSSSSTGTASSATTAAPASSSATTAASPNQRAVTDLVLDPSKDYGNRYADGILPVGDGQAVLDAPKKGEVYLCRSMGGGGGASARGPWFSADGTTYDVNQKVHVQGDVHWDGQFSSSVEGSTRVVTTNDLPVSDPTGVFPISPSDPAHQYDTNPNHITAQSQTYRLTADPQLLSTPQCMGNQSGVMTTGVALFNAFDAGERDAGAWEVQDGCEGHPERSGEYHYHTLSSCITDVSVSHVIGWALDGFPITGPKVADNSILTTADLDECHGITSTIELDGQQVTTYHYVMTQDFPYSVSCFRATPIQPPGARPGAG